MWTLTAPAGSVLFLLASGWFAASSRVPARAQDDLESVRSLVLAGLDALETGGSYSVDRRYLVFSLDGTAIEPPLSLARGVPGFDDVGAIARVLESLGAFARHSAPVPHGARRTHNSYRVTAREEATHQFETGVADERALVLVDTPTFLLDYQASNRQLGLHESGRLATLSISFLLRPLGYYANHHRDYSEWLWTLEAQDEQGVKLRVQAPPTGATGSPPSLLLLVDPVTGWIRSAAAYDPGGQFAAAGNFTFARIDERVVLRSATYLHCDAEECTIATADVSEHALARPGEGFALPLLTVLPGTGLFDFRVEPYDFLGREPLDWPTEVQAHLEPSILSRSEHRHAAAPLSAGAAPARSLWPLAVVAAGIGLLLAGWKRGRGALRPSVDTGGRDGG